MPRLYRAHGRKNRIQQCLVCFKDGFCANYVKENVHTHLIAEHPDECLKCNKCDYIDTAEIYIKEHKKEVHSKKLTSKELTQ